jgi:hypothetical protein
MPEHASRWKTDVRKAHQNQKKTVQPKSETNAPATRKINITRMNRKQTPPIQSSTQTRMDIWNSAMGDSLQFQHRNPAALSIQDCPIYCGPTLVHKQSQDPRRSVNEHSAQ